MAASEIFLRGSSKVNEPKPSSGRVGITEAARAFGVSTNTIRRRVKKGHLTAFQRPQPGGRPKYVFDVSDLVRVFGEPDSDYEKSATARAGEMPKHVTPQKNTENIDRNVELKEKIWRLESDHLALQARYDAQSRHLEDLQRLLTPRLGAPERLGERAARYLGDLARAFKGDKA